MEIGDNMNTYKIEIGGTDYTSAVPFPIKWQDLLDEQLDEATLTLLQVPKDNFKPLTDVKITIYNNKTAKHTLNMLVLSDKADETPSGSGKYNHEIALIEMTKWLEGFMVRSHGYVNSLGKIYADKTWDGQDI